MILADTSVWIDHTRDPDAVLSRHLSEGRILIHPFVIGELAMGTLARRDITIRELKKLETTVVAYNEEVLNFVAQHKLFGLGIGYSDAHLLVSVQMTANCTLWTRDKRLRTAAEKLDLNWPEPQPS